MTEHRDLLAYWSVSHGNFRRFLEELALPPLDASAQRTAGEAAAAAAIEATFGLTIDDFSLGIDSVGGAFNTAGTPTITPPDPDVPQDTEAAAFFDVDNTLIQGSSLILLAEGLARRRFITAGELFPALLKQIRYRLRGAESHSDIAAGREQALGIVKGKRVDELKALCQEIVERQMLDKAYQDTIELASMHIAAGQQVWLVSATRWRSGSASPARWAPSRRSRTGCSRGGWSATSCTAPARSTRWRRLPRSSALTWTNARPIRTASMTCPCSAWSGRRWR